MDGAIAECTEAVRLDKDYAEGHRDLALALHKKGDLSRAIAEFRAMRNTMANAQAHCEFGNALKQGDPLDEAIAEFHEAIRLKEDYYEAHCGLGRALFDQGQFADALASLKRGHELGSKRAPLRDPSAQWLQVCERLVELDGKLAAILSGQKQPADADERLSLASMCQQYKQYYAGAARFYGEAFAEKPQLADDLSTGNRYNAACAAAWPGAARARTPTVSTGRNAPLCAGKPSTGCGPT